MIVCQVDDGVGGCCPGTEGFGVVKGPLVWSGSSCGYGFGGSVVMGETDNGVTLLDELLDDGFTYLMVLAAPGKEDDIAKSIKGCRVLTKPLAPVTNTFIVSRLLCLVWVEEV